MVTKAGRRQLDASKPEEMGGVGGWVEEHPRVGAEVMDVEVAPDGGRRGLSAWRASAAVVQRRASLGGAARWSLASEEEPGRSPVLTWSGVERGEALGGVPFEQGGERMGRKWGSAPTALRREKAGAWTACDVAERRRWRRLAWHEQGR
jgi:hypothetical protein